MTIDDMLGRLFALIHDSEPCTREEYELDAAIRRTLEKVKEWHAALQTDDMLKWSVASKRVLKEIRDFDPRQEPLR